MKWWSLLLPAAAICWGGTVKTFKGVIHDNRCVGPNCATQCPITRGPKYTLQAGDEAWVLSDQKTPARYAGRRVVITGTVVSGNKLKVASITLAN